MTKFHLQADAYIEATDIDDAFRTIMLHFLDLLISGESDAIQSGYVILGKNVEEAD